MNTTNKYLLKLNKYLEEQLSNYFGGNNKSWTILTLLATPCGTITLLNNI